MTMFSKARFCALATTVLGAAMLMAAAPRTPAYTVTASLPGPDGHWDYAAFDPASGHVLVSHGGDMLVYDSGTAATPRSMGSFVGAHAALAVPHARRILVTSGRDDSVRFIDSATGEETAQIAVGKDPDAATIGTDGKTAYVMNAKDGTVSLIDLAGEKEVGRILLKPALEAVVQVSPTMLAVNNEDLGEIDLADLAGKTMAGTIPMPGCEGPTGIGYDPVTHLALSSCANGKAALVDIAHRKLVRLLDIGQGPDTVMFDAARRRFIVPCGRSGTLSLFAVSADGKVTALPSVKTEIGARTGALDPATGRLFLPTARFLPAAPGKRPEMAPGSFHLLVLSPSS